MMRWIVTASTLALMGAALMACSGESTAYKEACAADTAESYEAYLVEHPEGMSASDVRHRLDLKDFEAAEKGATVEAYEAYLTKHPDGRFADNADTEAEKLARAAAEKANTVEAMVAFKTKYGSEGGKTATDTWADKKLEILRYAQSVEITQLVVERVNISGERRGEPNGHVIRAMFKNGGERSVKVMKVRVDFLGEDNASVDHKLEFVATPSHPMGIPIPERLKLPMAPLEERLFEYMIGDSTAKKAWKADAEHVEIQVMDIEFAKAG